MVGTPFEAKTALEDVRPSAIAGTWYPGDRGVLAASVDHYLEESGAVDLTGPVIGLVAPHAGHLYSGHVAASAFAVVRGTEPEVVAVVSPLHHAHPAPVLTTAHSAYATPLGSIPVDAACLEAFERHLLEANLPLARVRADGEHSLEIELPFLQRVLARPFALLPVMIREQTESVAEAVGHALSRALGGRSALLVASSDLSHYQPAETARRLDAALLARLEQFDPQAVMRAEAEGAGYACGKGALAAVLWAARDLGANCVQVVKYAHSGQVTHDDDAVVGYGAAVIWRRPPHPV
jgi:AmmeMemoRadiSam system protein B